MSCDDAEYYRRRGLQEQLAAQNATCAVARVRHDELAMMYHLRAAILTTSPELWLKERPTTAAIYAE